MRPAAYSVIRNAFLIYVARFPDVVLPCVLRLTVSSVTLSSTTQHAPAFRFLDVDLSKIAQLSVNLDADLATSLRLAPSLTLAFPARDRHPPQLHGVFGGAEQ